jgi:flavodoxin
MSLKKQLKGVNMKTAVIYYSLDGNCAFVAKQIKKQMNADMVQIEIKDDKKRKGFIKILWGCFMVFGRKKPALKPYNFNPADYDLIFMGAPVWAGSPAPPLLTFISEAGINSKKIALYLCHASDKGKAMDLFKTLLSSNDIAAEIDFKNPVKNSETVTQQITDWVNGFKSA